MDDFPQMELLMGQRTGGQSRTGVHLVYLLFVISPLWNLWVTQTLEEPNLFRVDLWLHLVSGFGTVIHFWTDLWLTAALSALRGLFWASRCCLGERRETCVSMAEMRNEHWQDFYGPELWCSSHDQILGFYYCFVSRFLKMHLVFRCHPDDWCYSVLFQFVPLLWKCISNLWKGKSFCLEHVVIYRCSVRILAHREGQFQFQGFYLEKGVWF